MNSPLQRQLKMMVAGPLIVAFLVLPDIALARRFGGFGGHGGGGVHSSNRHASNRNAFRAGQRSGARHGYHRGYHQGFHAGAHRGFYAGHHGWGHWWHPVGFFLTTLAVTAVVVSVANKDYYYDQGVYYQKSTKSGGTTGYVVVQAPVGAKVPTLPPGNSPVTVAGGQTFYYYSGVFYAQDTDKQHYVVVQAPAGAVVPALPDGAKTENVNGGLEYVYGGVHYDPVFVNGQTEYAVVSP
jgi:hypothetical protein